MNTVIGSMAFEALQRVLACRCLQPGADWNLQPGPLEKSELADALARAQMVLEAERESRMVVMCSCEGWLTCAHPWPSRVSWMPTDRP